MRYCPVCSHIFEDDTVKFCPNDGRPLVDEASLSQVSSGQPLQSLAPAPDPEDIDSEDFDPEITLSRGRPKIQETIFPSESLNEAPPQEFVSAAAGVQPGIDGKPSQSNLSEPSSRSQPALQASLQSSPAESHPNLPANAQPSQPEAAPRLQSQSKPGRMRRLALLLIVVLVILLIPPVGAFFWWQHFKSSPAYYLAMLVDAVHRNDKPTVDQIVAMDQITDNFASQVTQSVLSQNSSAADAERKKLESSLTGFAPTIKQKVREEVEQQVKDEAALSAGKSLLTIALALYYKGGIKQTGNSATVAAQAHAVAWTLQRSDAGAWTIVGLKDDALAAQIQDQITSELPTTRGEKTPASASRQKNQTASNQQKNSANSSRAKKKESKKPEKGFRIELPFPDLQIELRPAPRN